MEPVLFLGGLPQITLSVMGPHVLWTVGEVVHNLVREVLFHFCVLQLVPQQCWLMVLKALEKSSGEILVKESSMQKEDDGLIHSHARLIMQSALGPRMSSAVVPARQGPALPRSTLNVM